MYDRACCLSTLFLSTLLGLISIAGLEPARAQGAADSEFKFTKIDLQLLDDINEVDRQIAKKGLVLENPDLQAYMDSICNRMIGKKPTPEHVQYRCLVLRDPMQNAFAEPNGTIYVTTGLLALLENEGELAGVIGHELTHTYRRHLYLENRSMRKKVLAMNILNAAASVAPGGPGVSTGVQVFGAAVAVGAAVTNVVLVASVYGYSRDMEQEADNNGLEAMSSASYDPASMARAFELLDQGSHYEFEPYDTFYHDHPKLTERRQAATAFASSHPVTAPLTTPEKDYIAKVAPAISYNIDADINSRRARSAVRAAQRLVDAYPDVPQYQLLLGDAYRALGAKTQALTDEEMTGHGKSEDRKNFFKRTEQEEQKRLLGKPEGQAALKANQAQAEKIYQAVAQANPAYADSYRDLGFLYEQEERYPEAATQYKRYLEMVAGTSLDHLRVERRLANVQKLMGLTSGAAQ